ncbi:acyl-CoA dehydrogenase domain protein [Hyphomonas polymorpha PS728]|uniref:Acyl-CoA dehydrogenase domain protein n=1 Tax=Hyphomonas polymorpha PS728 TaxID=1280954 RepID=A0A062VF68_9PROT|nr:acyl-CoA dehydrogenase family protein [Hyphomonas polymorpha]KCZ96640.1 acyl-CoA dehydrogenase domain protein [Hyphomonas polymorpha PS728]
MDFELNEEQNVFLNSLDALCRPFRELEQADRLKFSCYSPKLRQRLVSDGYLNAAEHNLSSLESALMVLQLSSLPCVAEVSTSAMILPALGIFPDGPVAIVDSEMLRPQRFLDVAKTALVLDGDDVVEIEIAAGEVEPVESILAYPYGRFCRAPDLTRGNRLHGAAGLLTDRRRIAVALECAGAARAATDFTVEYVKQRRVFGQPIGSFQAVQHRLAQCHQIANAMRILALRAAWSSASIDAGMAASYAQTYVHKLVFDLHQFNGGMGVTSEHLLHFWTYRLRALQAEAGGKNSAALSVADELWPLQRA